MASSSSSSSKRGQPSVDPYDALGISFGATNSEISKAYRKLALKLHPDKQKPGLSDKEQEDIAKKFHDIKEARAFLLDTEHAENRRQYDARRESERVRREADIVRDQQMSDRRKRMRGELKEKEAQARHASQKKQRKEKSEKELLDQLRREGRERREEQARREAEKEMERELRKERKERKTTLEERQVRLKWDRKKVKISHSEDSIASLLSTFGTVESVEFLGKKGNQALVTFADALSCLPCVDAYATSKEMRAKFVGQRKEQEDDDELDAVQSAPEPSRAYTTRGRDTETLEERRLRQAAEREALLRQMHQEGEEGYEGATTTAKGEQESTKPSTKRQRRPRSAPFPLPFPDTDALRDLSPFQKLERLETDILGSLLGPDKLLALRNSA